MPGNPLAEPTKNLKNANFPYTPEDGWGSPPVTAAPKAAFIASNPAFTDLGQNIRHVRITNGSQYPVITASDGEKAFNYQVQGKPSAYGDATLEIKYEILVATLENYHHIKFRQPDNFYHRKCLAVSGDLTQAQNWVKGDQIISSDGYDSVFYGYEPSEEDVPVIVLENYTGQFSQNWSGRTITNQRTGESFVSSNSYLIGNNNKLFHEWVDGEYPYANGGLRMEYDAAGDGNSKIQPYQSGSYINGVKETYGGTLGNQASGKSNDEIIFDTSDNGFDVEFVIGRVRSTTPTTPNGGMYFWKKSHRPGSPYEQWDLLFKNDNRIVWGDNSEGVHNAPTKGYLFGAANSGFEQETSFPIKEWNYWTQKPTFLP